MPHLFRPQFGLRDLFLATALTAYFFAARAHFWWTEALLLMAMLALAIGMIQQAGDIGSCLRATPELTGAARSGWWVAVGWRVLIALMLILSSGVNWAIERDWTQILFFAPFHTFTGYENAHRVKQLTQTLLVGVQLLSISIAACSAPWFVSQWDWLTRNRRQRLVSWLCVGGMLLGTLATSDRVIVALVHLAIEAIGKAQPYQIDGQRIGFNPVEHRQFLRLFAWLTVVGVSVVAVGLWSLRGAVAGRTKSTRVCGWFACVVCLFANLSFVIWLRTTGLRKVSPELYENQITWPWYCWFEVALVGLIVAGAATIRLDNTIGDNRHALRWRSSTTRYCNESRLLLGAMSAAMLASIWPSEASTLKEMLDHVVGIFSVPMLHFMVAILWIGVAGLFARRQRKSPTYLEQGYAMPVPTMIAAWLTIFVFVCCGVEMMQWMVFAVYGLPW